MSTSHESAQLDARSLALHRLAVEKIRQQPQLMAVVANNLARWRGCVSARTMPYIDAWQSLLDQGAEHMLSLAIEDSEFATAMRQSTPFAGVLTPQERWKFLREWRQKHAASTA